jgi:hypothetical protein
VPGLGQIRAGEPIRGALVIGLESYLIARVAVEQRRARRDDERADETEGTPADVFRLAAADHRDRRSDLLFWTAIAHMYNLIDAYVAAHLSEVDREIDDVHRLTWRMEPRAGGGDLSVTWTF